MPIIGNLAEFPLPEVLLLIGNRTGRLKLYDVPDVSIVELDLSEGKTHALHLSGSRLTEPAELVSLLSVIIEASQGMFEFRTQPIACELQHEPLPISKLVMMLIVHVDETVSRKRALQIPELFYFLERQPPDIAIDPGLSLFYERSRLFLANGVRAEELAGFMAMDVDTVRLNLGYLRQLGFVRPLDVVEVENIRRSALKQKITRKTAAFQLAAEASDLIRRSGRLWKMHKSMNNFE